MFVICCVDIQFVVVYVVVFMLIFINIGISIAMCVYVMYMTPAGTDNYCPYKCSEYLSSTHCGRTMAVNCCGLGAVLTGLSQLRLWVFG